MKRFFGSTSVALLVLGVSAGCDGHIAGSSAPGVGVAGGGPVGGAQGFGGAATEGPPDCTTGVTSAPLPTRLRRLTPAEYTSSLRSMLGEGVTLPALEFPPDAALGTFHNAAALLRVTDLLAGGLADAAQKLALSATAQLPPLLGCDPAQADADACVRGFLEAFGTKAYRRPLSATELQRLLDVYQLGKSSADVRAGVALALEVMFQSPHLLYRTELGARDALEPEVSLTPYELASEISYLVTLAPPDAELTRAAATGELMDPSLREAQAHRLLSAPTARTAMSAFVTEWLDISKLPTLSKDPAMFPAFTPDVARSMQQDTQQLFTGVVFEGDGTLRSLLLGGLLTQPSVLASHAGTQWSSPTHRGKMIRNQLLCQQVPPPPPGLIVTVPPATPGVTTRQRMLTHATDPACGGCHLQMDPLGFAFEHYDAVGAYRADEQGLPIDASGQLSGSTDADGPFADAAGLLARLGESATVRACFAKQWTTYAVGGAVDSALYCSLGQAFAELRAERLSLPAFLVSVVRSDSFVKRHVSRP